MVAAEQAEGVVLLGGQIVAGEQLVLQRPQPVVRPPEAEKCLLFEGIEPSAGSGRLCPHARMLLSRTTVV